MTNLSSLLNSSFKFLKEYCSEYFKLLLKPLLCALFGILIMIIIQQNPNIALLGLISIPLFCYAFWNGYLITFALNYAAILHKNNQKESLENFISKINRRELASFLSFSAIITIIGYLPSLIYIFKTIDMSILTNPALLLSNTSELIMVFLVLLLNNLVLVPFFNFFNQAYFFKKENENFITLFFNCYKKLDKDGWVLSILFGFIGWIISLLHPLIYLVFALLLNLITFSANALWFCERFEREKPSN